MRHRFPWIASLLSLWLLAPGPAGAVECAAFDQQMRLVWSGTVSNGTPTGFALVGVYGLVTGTSSHLGHFSVIDLTAPESPLNVFSAFHPYSLGNLVADGNLACVISEWGGYLGWSSRRTGSAQPPS